MKKGRRLLAILMAICLVCAYMPVSVFGEGEQQASSTYTMELRFDGADGADVAVDGATRGDENSDLYTFDSTKDITLTFTYPREGDTPKVSSVYKIQVEKMNFGENENPVIASESEFTKESYTISKEKLTGDIRVQVWWTEAQYEYDNTNYNNTDQESANPKTKQLEIMPDPGVNATIAKSSYSASISYNGWTKYAVPSTETSAAITISAEEGYTLDIIRYEQDVNDSQGTEVSFADVDSNSSLSYDSGKNEYTFTLPMSGTDNYRVLIYAQPPRGDSPQGERRIEVGFEDFANENTELTITAGDVSNSFSRDSNDKYITYNESGAPQNIIISISNAPEGATPAIYAGNLKLKDLSSVENSSGQFTVTIEDAIDANDTGNRFYNIYWSDDHYNLRNFKPTGGNSSAVFNSRNGGPAVLADEGNVRKAEYNGHTAFEFNSNETVLFNVGENLDAINMSWDFSDNNTNIRYNAEYDLNGNITRLMADGNEISEPINFSKPSVVYSSENKTITIGNMADNTEIEFIYNNNQGGESGSDNPNPDNPPQPPQSGETETGNLDMDVNIVFWICELQIINEVPQYVYRKAENNANMEGIRLNNLNVAMNNGSGKVVRGGYALGNTENKKNTLVMHDAFGAKADNVFLINVEGFGENQVINKIEGGDFSESFETNDNLHTFSKELDPATTYNIAIKTGVSDDLTIIWTTNYDIADKWNDKVEGGDFNRDMYVEHGRVEVQSIKRGYDIIYDATKSDVQLPSGISISDDFGYLQLKRGDDIVLKLIPDYGYQLKRVGGNEGESLAQSLGMVPKEDEVSTFTFSNIQNNIHFAAVFEKADNSYSVSGSNVSDVTVQNDKNAITSGTLAVTVADATAEDVSGIVSGEAKTVDISINNVISKGNTENWSSIVSELSSPVEVTLSTEIEIGQEYAVVRNHNGQLKEIQCSADAVNNTISFESDKFSTYTIVKKAKNESGSITPSTPAPSVPSDNTITNSGSGSDASTSVDVSDKTTVTDSKAETKVDADLGNKIVENALKNNSTDVVINAGTSAGDSAGSTVTLPESTVKALAKDTEASVTIKTDSAEVSLDKDAVAAVAAQAGSEGEVKLVVETKEQNKNKVEIELTLVTSNGTVSSFNGGTVTVTVPVSQELADKKVVCVYIDENGKYHKVDGAINEAGTHYTFTTGHFSTYAVMAEEDAEAVIKQQTADEQKAKIKKVKATVTLSTKDLKKGIRVTVKVPDDQKADKTGIIIYRSTKKDAKTYAVYKKVATKGSTYIIRNTKNVKGQKLTSGKKYYYKVRAYKVIDGKTYYGPMSSVKSIKAK